MAKTSYLVALGSNRRHGRYGAPAETLKAAVRALAAEGLDVDGLSRIRSTPALGPAGRGFANAAARVTTDLAPPELLRRLKSVERAFGRRAGRRWGPRVLDLDIILWSEGWWADGAVIIPHPEFRKRSFVLAPLAAVAPAWRDPLTGATVRQLFHRLRRASPVDRGCRPS
ncbi:2-amino-4-hydroxy-6-hydroxymethyldihydropteridine diphosphokinase [Sphingosinicella sp. BN140058]|uniref:2-amino-4-hydroxy-6- hydroxymethyldihydropteridine diphosphokinase n=1 Tax=Sphingosinicella sp. BN140058 TaxID=1892855 RepID=UPI0010102F67|nr:2-amino-4-hydroxy-6-hydroxymethyldihydropteridine diphosphokinase [Sphingosinicella sp. BN140058]QAY79555.1 2-amino-4-hydroxy-6-hydroxymethyldihydropteridine diphosphokinase [Sphingosinicella sp. BN140058]